MTKKISSLSGDKNKNLLPIRVSALGPHRFCSVAEGRRTDGRTNGGGYADGDQGVLFILCGLSRGKTKFPVPLCCRGAAKNQNFFLIIIVSQS